MLVAGALDAMLDLTTMGRSWPHFCAHLLVLSMKLLAGKVCFYVFMCYENEPVMWTRPKVPPAGGTLARYVNIHNNIQKLNSYVENITRARCGHLKIPKHVEST